MNERFNPPTRDQLNRVANGDIRLIRAFEQIFEVAGQDFYTVQESLADVSAKADANEADITAIEANVAANVASISVLSASVAANTASISALSAVVAGNTSDISANSARIKTNEVLSWLSV